MKGTGVMKLVTWCFINIRRMQPVDLAQMSLKVNNPELGAQ